MKNQTIIDIHPKNKETLTELSKRAVNQSNLNSCIVHVVFADSVTVVSPYTDYLTLMKKLKVKELTQSLSKITLKLKEAKA